MTEKMERPAKDVIEERVRRIQNLKAEKVELETRIVNAIAWHRTDGTHCVIEGSWHPCTTIRILRGEDSKMERPAGHSPSNRWALYANQLEDTIRTQDLTIADLTTRIIALQEHLKIDGETQ